MRTSLDSDLHGDEIMAPSFPVTRAVQQDLLDEDSR